MRLMLLCFLLSISTKSISQDTRDKYQLNLLRSGSAIVLDGNLDEEGWAEASKVSDFINQWPVDSGMAEAKTEVKVIYDDNFLYVSAILYDNGTRVIQSLKRDNDGHWGSDGFTVVVDPINERSNGFMFGVNAGGAQMEGVLTVNSWGTDGDRNWDNKWYSKVVQYKDRWQVEMAIPFKTLRYNPNNTSWGINFIRNDMERNIYSTWTQIPVNFGAIELGYNGLLIWDHKPPLIKGKIAVIPYLAGGVSRNHEDAEPTSSDLDAGLDAKVAVTSSLNLDLTVNPDFSNVDVDQQVTNLSRFSLFFPERRNFFLENSDLFSEFGRWNVRPFFSRRIGLNDGDPVPIKYGARLSGNLAKGLRIGLMDIQTAGTDDQSAQNYAVGAFQKRVLSRSSIKGIWVNRQSNGKQEDGVEKDYNRVGGLEFEFLSMDGKWSANIKHHQSFTPEKSSANGFYSALLTYQSRTFFWGITASQVDRDFVADVGFTPRLDNYDAEADTTVRLGYRDFNPWVGYNHYPEGNSPINMHGPRFWAVWTFNADGSFNERLLNLVYFVNFKSSAEARIRIRQNGVDLPFSTDLIGDDVFLPAKRYDFTEVSGYFATNSRKRLSGDFNVTYGSFYNGTKLTISSSLNIRRQPWGNFGIAYTQNRVDLEEFGNTDLHLLGPRAEVSFSNKMFWTTFLQYNTQAENFNINSRFQWRYKPMSDIFIVYTDNYTTTALTVKNRGLIFKMTYWLNL
ncbi:MAG: DUF5916 domain-containing protein [Bacteroidota bacterium]